jgi:YD repeat-containing protein
MKALQPAAKNLTYAYNARAQVTSITDGVLSSENRAFGYDAMGRLISANGPWGSGSYKYDSLGNLRQKVEGAITTAIGYSATTNRAGLITETSQPSATLTYDDCGSVMNNGAVKIEYGAGAAASPCWSGEAVTLRNAGTSAVLAS